MRHNRFCMGLSSTPYVFSKVSDFVVRCMVMEGFSDCINYLDDFCVLARTEEECVKAQWALVPGKDTEKTGVLHQLQQTGAT